MLRKRLIFSLIFADGYFTQSRNFRLQKVGDINWLENNYNFREISFSLDELVILNASRNEKNVEQFTKVVKRLAESLFLPIAAGGGINSVEHAEQLFKNGADKITLNTLLIEDPKMVEKICSVYGSQSIVAYLDFTIIDKDVIFFVSDGNKKVEMSPKDYLRKVQSHGVGEIVLNSIDKDGTGFGYDLHTIETLKEFCDVPLIISGGAGNEKHLHEGISLNGVSAVATANLFNFIGNGLPNARKYLINHGIDLAIW